MEVLSFFLLRRNLVQKCKAHATEPHRAEECKDYGEEENEMSTGVKVVIALAVILIVVMAFLVAWKMGCFGERARVPVQNYASR